MAVVRQMRSLAGRRSRHRERNRNGRRRHSPWLRAQNWTNSLALTSESRGHFLSAGQPWPLCWLSSGRPSRRRRRNWSMSQVSPKNRAKIYPDRAAKDEVASPRTTLKTPTTMIKTPTTTVSLTAQDSSFPLRRRAAHLRRPERDRRRQLEPAVSPLDEQLEAGGN